MPAAPCRLVWCLVYKCMVGISCSGKWLGGKSGGEGHGGGVEGKGGGHEGDVLNKVDSTHTLTKRHISIYW